MRFHAAWCSSWSSSRPCTGSGEPVQDLERTHTYTPCKWRLWWSVEVHLVSTQRKPVVATESNITKKRKRNTQQNTTTKTSCLDDVISSAALNRVLSSLTENMQRRLFDQNVQCKITARKTIASATVGLVSDLQVGSTILARANRNMWNWVESLLLCANSKLKMKCHLLYQDRY